MNNLKDLKKAIRDKKILIWNDPDPIKGNDYIISFIEKIDENFDRHTPIFIQYNNGLSEAQVFLHEILIHHE